MTAAIEVEALEKRYGARHALHPSSLGVAEGAFCCVVGPSGCGKTTLLRLIAGLETPSAGQVRLGGVDVTGLPASKRGVGVVFQSYALFPNLSAEANVAFGLHGRPEWRSGEARRARVDEMLRTVELGAFAKSKPQRLSGGQQQRVALARALAPAPKILLLDEPLSALDPQVRASLRAELKAVQARVGVTAMMVTHDREEALALADVLVVMRAGRIEQTGAPREVFAHPKSPFVAEFVAGMSLLTARAASEGTKVAGVAVPNLAAVADAMLVAIAADGAAIVAPDAAGAVPAVVKASEFAGRHVVVVAALPEIGAELRVAAPAGVALAVGERIGLAIDGARAIAFPADAAIGAPS